jgi:hypothetical protein
MASSRFCAKSRFRSAALREPETDFAVPAQRVTRSPGREPCSRHAASPRDICDWACHPGSFAGVDRGLVRYFTRLHTDSALVPVEVAGFVL